MVGVMPKGVSCYKIHEALQVVLYRNSNSVSIYIYIYIYIIYESKTRDQILSGLGRRGALTQTIC